MTTRQALKDMIDRVPEDRLPEAEQLLAPLTNEFGAYSVDDAPLEDEQLTEREIAAIRRFDRGERDTVSYTREQVERLLDDASG
jgi:hypothetical protein